MKRTLGAVMIAAVTSLGGCGGSSGGLPATPGAPTSISATLDAGATAVVVSFSPPADPGGSPITGYSVSSIPIGLSQTGSGSPLTVACPGSCAGYSIAVSAVNAGGTGAASATAHVVSEFDVVATFFEPVTDPYHSIFTGTFTLDSTLRTVSNLRGSLTQSMTPPPGPMTTVALAHQLSALPDGLGGHGLLVTTFLRDTVDTFCVTDSVCVAAGVTYPLGTFDPHNANALYFGFPAAWSAPTANAYVMIQVDTDHPTSTATRARLDLLAYADCTAGGMMGPVCMTGTTVAGYGHVGSMAGYPVSQVITKHSSP